MLSVFTNVIANSCVGDTKVFGNGFEGFSIATTSQNFGDTIIRNSTTTANVMVAANTLVKSSRTADVSPGLPTSNCTDRVGSNAKFITQRRRAFSVGVPISNFKNLDFCEFGLSRSFTFGNRAVTNAVRNIRGMSIPPKIGDMVVQWVVVMVAGLQSVGTWPDKRFENNDMDAKRSPFRIATNSYFRATLFGQRLFKNMGFVKHLGVSVPPRSYPAMIRDFVSSATSDFFPSFSHVIPPVVNYNISRLTCKTALPNGGAI